jgi:hypothetical protein
MKTVLLAVAMALTATTAQARSTGKVCAGTIGQVDLSAYLAVGDECVVLKGSSAARRILKACPINTVCTVDAEVDNTPLTYEIFDVHSVYRFHGEGQK